MYPQSCSRPVSSLPLALLPLNTMMTGPCGITNSFDDVVLFDFSHRKKLKLKPFWGKWRESECMFVSKSSDGRVAILLLTVLYQGLKTSTVVQDCLPCERAQDQDRDISVIATLSVCYTYVTNPVYDSTTLQLM